MKVFNYGDLLPDELAAIVREIGKPQNLAQMLMWANSRPKSEFCPTIIAEVIVQDEFTHDCIVPFRDHFLVYDTTWLGSITAVAVWKEKPDAEKILQARLEKGWQPMASALQTGDKIMGYAACMLEKT